MTSPSFQHLQKLSQILADEPDSVPIRKSMNYAVAQAYVREVFPYLSNTGLENITQTSQPQEYLVQFWGKVHTALHKIVPSNMPLLSSDHLGPSIFVGLVCGQFHQDYFDGLSKNHLLDLLRDDYAAFNSGKKALCHVYGAYKSKQFNVECASEFDVR